MSFFILSSYADWKIGADHYWPFTDSKEILGTTTGKSVGSLTTGINSMQNKGTFLQFDGGSSYVVIPGFRQSCVSVPNNCFYGITFSFLIGLPSLLQRDRGVKYIMDIKGQGSPDAVGYSVYIYNGKIGVFVRDTYSYYDTTVTVPLGRMIHFAFSYSGQNGLTIYVNGNKT